MGVAASWCRPCLRTSQGQVGINRLADRSKPSLTACYPTLQRKRHIYSPCLGLLKGCSLKAVSSSILTDKISKLLYQKSSFSVSATYPPTLPPTKWLFYKNPGFPLFFVFLKGVGNGGPSRVRRCQFPWGCSCRW